MTKRPIFKITGDFSENDCFENPNKTRPAKSPDLGRGLPAFSLHCRLSGFDVYFTGEIKNSAVIFILDRVFYYLQ